MLGAPWINAAQLNNALNDLQLPGIKFSSVTYKAITPPYANENCSGVQISITDAAKLNAVHTGISILQTISAIYPQELQERLYQTHANPSGTKHLEKLLGLTNAWPLITDQQHINTNCDPAWLQHIHSFLLYK
jgi:uncharacterized protein YbbC (DUF1343 family)